MQATETFMEFLHNQYLLSLEEDKQARINVDEPIDAKDFEPSLADFIEWADHYLSNENRPINVSYLQVGLGLRMQRGQTLGFSPQPVGGGGQMYDEGVHITRPGSQPGQGMIPSGGVQVTGS